MVKTAELYFDILAARRCIFAISPSLEQNNKTTHNSTTFAMRSLSNGVIQNNSFAEKSIFDIYDHSLGSRQKA